MSTLNFSKRIQAPIEAVFAAFSDFENAARIDGIESVEMLTDGPVGVGTRFRETRVMFGKEATEEMEVTGFAPNKSITIAADSCGSHFETDFVFDSDGDATTVDITMEIQPVTLIAKLTSPLGFLMKGTMKKMMDADFEQIKNRCEIADH